MVLTFTLLPAVTLLLVKKRKEMTNSAARLTSFADFVINNHIKVLIAGLVTAIALIAMMPLNVVDDDPISYFKKGVPFRDASEFSIKHLPAVKDLSFSITCGEASCINEPQFLSMLDDFSNWLKTKPSVEHVSSYSNVIKRLNKSMNII